MKKGFLMALMALCFFSIFAMPEVSSARAIPGQTLDSNQAAIREEVAKAIAGNSDDGGISWFGKVFAHIILSLSNFLVGITTFITGIVGIFFDMVVDFTVVKTEDFMSKFEGSINIGWTIVRDICNIAIVFSLLYISIRTILQGEGFADRGALASILLAAVLINFSLFFTKTIFEMSNFVGAQVFEQIQYGGDSDPDGQKISGSIMQMLQTPSALNDDVRDSAVQAGWGEVWAKVQHALLASFIIISLSFIFIAAGLMLLYRSIVFLFLMISSPIGLVGKLVPWLKEGGDKWWAELKSQAIFLPAFTLSMYICLYVIGSISQTNKGNFSSSEGAVMGIYVFEFIMVFVFLIAMLVIPLKISAGGSGVMSNISNWATKKIKSVPRRAVQFGGKTLASGTAVSSRYLVGNKLANRMGGNTPEALKKLQERARDGSIGARIRLNAAEKLKAKTYDVRNVGGLGKKLGIGEGIKTWEAAVKERQGKIEGERDKKMKLYGYDKAHETQANRNNTTIKEAERNAQITQAKITGDALQNAQLAYTQATANGGTASAAQLSALTQAREAHDAAQKELEKRELEVGRAKNIGMQMMYDKMEKKWRNKMTPTRIAAMEKMKKEMEKKFKEDGKKKTKKTRNSNNPPPTP